MTGLPHQRRSVVSRIAETALLVMTGLGLVLTAGSPASAAGSPATSAGVPGVDAAAGSGAGWRASPTLPVARDSIRDEQWQLDEFHAEALWRVSTGRGVTVAVIDSGVDGSHPDLAGQVLPGTDLVEEDGNGQTDPVGHGTTVAGLIAGRNDDGQGVVGLAPDAKILPVRVLDAENRYDDALIVAKGVRWAVDNGAQVINLSLGGHGDSLALAAALDYAFARNVVVIACTGNEAPSTPDEVWYPAREPGVVAVAGLERDTTSLWSGSITGPETVLTAPATGLLGARPDGFWRVQGTSFAAPLVAASAALVRSRWPDLSAADVINRLISTAQDLGVPGRDDTFGFGLVNPLTALNGEVSKVEHNPLDADEAPPGVSGFGAAPGLEDSESKPAGGRPGEAGVHQTGAVWAAQVAGGGEYATRGGLWSGGLLFLAAVTGGALVIRRSRSLGSALVARHRRRFPQRSDRS